MNSEARRRQGSVKQLLTGTAAVDPAIQASAERAAIERDPAIDSNAPPAVDGPIVPAAAVPDNAAVLPEPTLVARPDAPQPIVTASPILAIEPNATDVVKADAKADRVAAGLEPTADPEGPHSAAAGQPTLTIEGNAAISAASAAQAGATSNSNAVLRILGGGDDRDTSYQHGSGDYDGVDGLMREHRSLSLDEVLRGLEHLALVDPIGMDIIRTRFFDTPPRAFDDGTADRDARPSVPTVTVIEVVGPPQGRRRAGRSFGTQPQRFLEGELGEGELASLRSDPLLAVGVSEVEADVFGMPIAGR